MNKDVLSSVSGRDISQDADGADISRLSAHQ